jgi:hypothetical protein
VISSDFFGRKDMLPGLGPAQQFMDAVFATPDKAPPDMAPASQGIVVFQLLEIKPPATPTFEEIRSRVEEEFKGDQSRSLLAQKAQELSDHAKNQHDLKRAAKELGATVKTSDLVSPDGQVPDVGSMSGQASVVFTMKPGDISGPINFAGQTAGALRSLRCEPGRRNDQVGQDQAQRSGTESADEGRRRARHLAAVTCLLRAPQAFCCIPRRCLRAAASATLVPRLTAL